jgi:hypothetical protein
MGELEQVTCGSNVNFLTRVIAAIWCVFMDETDVFKHRILDMTPGLIELFGGLTIVLEISDGVGHYCGGGSTLQVQSWLTPIASPE